MVELPKTLEDAIAQAREATQAAIAAGQTRLQVELLFPELKPMPVAEQFISVFADFGPNIKVYFPDAGAAALARRDWGPMAFEVRGLGELKGAIQPEDQAFILVAPSSVELAEVEKVCDTAGDRPVVMLNPFLEDVYTIGIGYAGRQLRERFLNLFAPCYYLRPLEKAAVFRCYPASWQVWQETATGDYELLREFAERPSGDELDQILYGTPNAGETTATPAPGLFTGLKRFIRALNQ